MFYLLSCNDKGVTVVRIQFANSNTYYDKDDCGTYSFC